MNFVSAALSSRRGWPADERDAGQAIGMDGDQPAGEDRAERVADDVRALDLEVIEQPDHVLGELVAVRLRIVRLAALAVGAQIHRDRAMVPGDRREHAVGDEVAIERAGVAVQHHHRRARRPARRSESARRSNRKTDPAAPLAGRRPPMRPPARVRLPVN